MNDAFDPYHKWLGIPPAEQPPNHYRLLGITVFESDPDVIEAATFRQTAHVRTYQIGPHSDLSQKLLNEIAAAKVCLLDPKKKAAYDEELQARLGAGSGQSAVPPPVSLGPPTEPPVTAKPVASARQEHTRRKNPPWPVYAAVGAGALLLVVLLAVLLLGPKSDEVANTDQKRQPEDETADVETPSPSKPEPKVEPAAQPPTQTKVSVELKPKIASEPKIQPEPSLGKPLSEDEGYESVFLTELKPGSVKAAPFSINSPLSSGGTMYRHSIHAHPTHWDTPARVVFDLRGRYHVLVGSVSIKDEENNGKPICPQSFFVIGDDKEIWKSKPIRSSTEKDEFRIDISGVHKLELCADTLGESHFGAHNVWIDPRLLRRPHGQLPIRSVPAATQSSAPSSETPRSNTLPKLPVVAIPPPPADAEDQLRNGLAKAQSLQEFRAVAEKALHYVDQAIVANAPETAKKLVTWAVAAAREAQIDDLSKTASLRYLELQRPLTEDVILGAKKRLESWKPMERLDQEAHSAASVPNSAPPQRSLADLLNGDDVEH